MQVYDVAWDDSESGTRSSEERQGQRRTIAFGPVRGEQPELLWSEVGDVSEQRPRLWTGRKAMMRFTEKEEKEG